MADGNAEKDLDLRRLLAEAPVTATRPLPPGTRCSLAICVVTLDGVGDAFWKRGDLDPPGVVGVRREVAAYELALLLGWYDLLQTVALREEPVDGGGTAEIASIELLPEGNDGLAADEFDGDSISRAGVFDAIIANPDRAGHNWRGIPADDGYRLKLYDHELSFTVGGQTSSTFWTQIGQVVPEDLRPALGALQEQVGESVALKTLLSDEEFAALQERVRALSGC